MRTRSLKEKYLRQAPSLKYVQVISDPYGFGPWGGGVGEGGIRSCFTVVSHTKEVHRPKVEQGPESCSSSLTVFALHSHKPLGVRATCA